MMTAATAMGSLRSAPHPGDRDESLLEALPVIEPAGDLCLNPLVGKQTHHIRRVDKDIDMTLVVAPPRAGRTAHERRDVAGVGLRIRGVERDETAHSSLTIATGTFPARAAR